VPDPVRGDVLGANERQDRKLHQNPPPGKLNRPLSCAKTSTTDFFN